VYNHNCSHLVVSYIVVIDSNEEEEPDTTAPTAILERSLLQETTMTVYPNPNSGEFMMEIGTRKPGNYQLSIFASGGNLIHRENCAINYNYARSFTDLKVTPGIYFIKLSSNMESVIKKVIIN
jgi:hypothetical protein